MRIGELAARTGLRNVTIRYYEREGLLPPPGREANNYRRYTETHVERLRFIGHCRELNMPLAAIRTLLDFTDRPDETCETVNGLLDEQIRQVEERLVSLEQLRSQLTALRKRCDHAQAAAECGILQGLGEGARSSEAPR